MLITDWQSGCTVNQIDTVQRLLVFTFTFRSLLSTVAISKVKLKWGGGEASIQGAVRHCTGDGGGVACDYYQLGVVIPPYLATQKVLSR